MISMSHTSLWRHIVLLKAGVYSSSHGVLYRLPLNQYMTGRFYKGVSVLKMATTTVSTVK